MPVCFPELYSLYYNKMKSLLLTSDLFFQDLFHASAHWYHLQIERHDETLVVSGLIISCYLAVVGCLWQENMLTSAWKGTAYYKTPYHMQEIETAFRRVIKL